MGKVGWIVYSILFVGLCVLLLIRGEYGSLGMMILGWAFGVWLGGTFPWEEFK